MNLSVKQQYTRADNMSNDDLIRITISPVGYDSRGLPHLFSSIALLYAQVSINEVIGG